MKKIVLIQHCESNHHISNLTGGWTDSELTSLGKTQAVYTAKEIKKYFSNNAKLYSSDLKRAEQTARAISEELLIPITIEAGLREINNGVAANKTKEWANINRLPKTKSNFDFNYIEWENAESWKDFYERISRIMQIIYSSDEENIIVVTHGCAIGYIIKWWLFITTEEQISKTHFQGCPGGITYLEENMYGQHTIGIFNKTDHIKK